MEAMALRRMAGLLDDERRPSSNSPSVEVSTSKPFCFDFHRGTPSPNRRIWTKKTRERRERAEGGQEEEEEKK